MKTRKRSIKRAMRRTPARRGVPTVPQPALEIKPSLPPVPPEKKMKTIWFMVGLVLLTMGGVIFLSGLYYLVNPSAMRTVLSHLQPDVWWGAIMVLAGLTFVLTQRKSTAG